MVLCKLQIKKGPGLSNFIHGLTAAPFYFDTYFTVSVPPTPAAHRHTNPYSASVVFPVGINSLTREDTTTEEWKWAFRGRIPVFGPGLSFEHWAGMRVEGSYRTDAPTGEIVLLGEKLPVRVKEIKVGPCEDVHLWVADFGLYPPLNVVTENPEKGFQMAVSYLGEIGFPKNPDAYQLFAR